MADADPLIYPSGEDVARPSLRAWYALAIVLVATVFGFVDGQLIVLVTEPLKRDLGFSDAQIGILQGVGPGLFGAVGAILTGWLADRMARQIIMCGCVVFWSAATAWFGFAHSFMGLIMATVAVGLGEAAIAPVFYSMVPDLFPGRSRLVANLVFYGAIMTGTGFAVAVGGAVVGWLDSHRAALPLVLVSISTWRLAFLLVALPGIVIAPAILLIGRIARRSGSSEEAKAPSSLLAYFRKNGVGFAALCAAVGFYMIAFNVITFWMPPHLIRDLHSSVQQAGYGLGLAFTVGTLAGMFAAGIGVRLLTPRFGVLAPLRLYQAAMICAVLPLLLQLLATTPWQACVLVGIQVTVSATGVALMPTLLQDIAPAEVRGSVVGLLTFATSVMGALSPTLVGRLSDALATKGGGLLWSIVAIGAPSLLLACAITVLFGGALGRTIRAYAPPMG